MAAFIKRLSSCSANIRQQPWTIDHQRVAAVRRVCRVVPRAIQDAATEGSKARFNYQMSVEDEPEVGECHPALVRVDNNAHKEWTCLHINVSDYPGLLRTIAWVLNGMGMRVQNASLQTADGWARDTFWVTTYSGSKLNDNQASILAERVQDFVVFCEPKACDPVEWGVKNLRIANNAHPKFTVLTIEGEPKRQGFLLELASVLTGTGTQVQEAYIQSGPTTLEAPEPDTTPGATQPINVAPSGYDFSKGRYFKFLLSNQQGEKLDAAEVGAILFTYDVFTDSRHMPLVAPNMDLYLKKIEQCQ